MIVLNLRASIIISNILPGVLLTFIIMRYTGIDANIVALWDSDRIGLMIDIGVVRGEYHSPHGDGGEQRQAEREGFIELIKQSVSEVSRPILTAALTTVVSFSRVFLRHRGKLFSPLAYTKTCADSSLRPGHCHHPHAGYYILSVKVTSKKVRDFSNILLAVVGIGMTVYTGQPLYLALILFALNNLFAYRWENSKVPFFINIGIAIAAVLYLLTVEWLPMGTRVSVSGNLLFVILIITLILGILWSGDLLRADPALVSQ